MRKHAYHLVDPNMYKNNIFKKISNYWQTPVRGAKHLVLWFCFFISLYAILGFALTEAIALFALMVVFLILFARFLCKCKFPKVWHHSTSLCSKSAHGANLAPGQPFDRASTIQIFGLTLNRYAFVYAFIVVYPLITAVALALKAAFFPVVWWIPIACFGVCVILYIISARKCQWLVRFFFHNGWFQTALILIMRVHIRLKLVSVSWWLNRFLLQLVSGLLLFTLLVFRAALVNDLAQYPGCLVLFNMLLVVNVVTAMIFAYWRLTKNLYMVVAENWPESLLCKAPLVILQTHVLTMRGITEMAEGLGKLIEKLQQHSARGATRGILDVMRENTSRYGGSQGGPQSTTS